MGRDVNFDNSGEEFNISLTTAGELSFLANDKNGAGDRRMVIRDGANEVGFDGRITVDDQVEVGGAGQFGSIQLRADDGVNTIFLGSDQDSADILVGGGGYDGRIQLFDDNSRATIDLRADSGIINVGTNGQDGDVTVLDSAGRSAIQMDGQVAQLRLFHDNLTTIRLDGALGYVTVGANGENGTLDLLDNAGNVRIRLVGETGTIEFRDSNGIVIRTLP
jgi:hypothetical protein